MTMNPFEIQSKLDEVTIHQLLFKTDKMKALVLTILEEALRSGRFWPDEISIDFLGKEDRNCVGTAYRILSPQKKDDAGKARGPGIGIIAKTGQFRSSKAKGQNGCAIFEYMLIPSQRRAAWAFVSRHNPKTARAAVDQVLPGIL